MNELPKSWSKIEITKVLGTNNNGKPFQQGWSPRCESFQAPEGKWGVLKTTAIQQGRFCDHENKCLPDHLEPRSNLEVKPGDVLITCAGPRIRCGVACLVVKTRTQLMLSGKMYRFRPHPQAMHPKYLAYMLQDPEVQLEIDRMKTGINDSGLNLTHNRFAGLKVALAPFREQHRIVAKIEELFSELDNGVDSLKTAQAQLKVYRQAVLKQAFEGKLTAKWRKENKDKLETPGQLLARIKQEREARYEQQLQEWETAVKEWEENGKLGKKPRKPRDSKQAAKLSKKLTHGYAELPLGWVWATIDSIFDVVSGSTPKGLEQAQGSGIPFYKVSDMNTLGNETWMYTAAIYLSEEEKNELGLTTYPENTVIFPKRGGAILTNKKRVLSRPSCFDLNTMGVINSIPSILNEYLWLWFQSFNLAEIYDGSNVPQINNKNVEPLPFPICSTQEQREISNILGRTVSLLNKTDVAISQELQKAAVLRQSVLNNAFSGQLVPQDPSDEPASVLLDRIRAEKEQGSKKGESARKIRKKRKTTA